MLEKYLFMLRIIHASNQEHYQQAYHLFQLYAESLDFDLDFQNFSQELAGLPGDYAPPKGCVLLAEDANDYVGCVALRPLQKHICEMKRLYLRPKARGKQIGRLLAETVIDAAKRIGYKRMRLDTVGSMQTAIGLYRELGFYEIEPYRRNPHRDASFLELVL
jgi:ribosomal protein S18 acetylase RimI-like enzyme